MTGRAPAVPPSRIASWFIGCALVGWLIAYNVLRLGGDSPSAAALPGLLVGGGAGLLVFAVGAIVVHRLHASGRVVIGHPTAGAPRPASRSALQAAGVALGVAGVASLGVAGLMMLDYLGIEGDRPKATILLVVWNVAFGLWVLDEALGLHREDRALRASAAPGEGPARVGEAWQGLDAVWSGALLTCVLAGVAYSRDIVSGAQLALVAVVGATAVIVGVALWMLRGGRGAPMAAVIALVVAVASILLPAVV